MQSVGLTLLSLVKITSHPRIPVIVDINVADVVKIPASSTCKISSEAILNTSKLKMKGALIHPNREINSRINQATGKIYHFMLIIHLLT